MNWRETNEYASQLRLGGYSDWRLPTIEELEQLYDPKGGNKFDIRKPFELTSYWVWSSTRRGSSHALLFYFASGKRDSFRLGFSDRAPYVCVVLENDWTIGSFGYLVIQKFLTGCAKLSRNHMVGYVRQSEEEEIYGKYLREMRDDRLEEEARDYVWLCETSLGGPWPIYTWKRDFVRVECEKRGQPERFERALETILQDVMDRFCTHGP
jgi:hypothetical protein